MRGSTAIRVVGLAALPWMVVFGATLVYWPLFYYLSPIFLPTFCYQLAHDGNWSILVREPWGTLVALSYTVACALVAVRVSRNRGVLASVAVTAASFLVSAVTAHAVLRYLFRFRFYMDSP
jgi:hypothetical protein